jgi:hypothetical protein
LRGCDHLLPSRRCNPSITLSNLIGSDTGNNAAITVTLYNNKNSATSSVRTGSWVQSTGTLTLQWFDAASMTASEIPANQRFKLTFGLQNPTTAQASPTTLLSVFLEDNYHEPSEHASSTMDVPGNNQNEYLMVDSAWVSRSGSGTACQKNNGDANPLFIRTVTFSEEFASGNSLTSGSKNPCASSLITVQLRTTGPVFKSCVTQITLSGLTDKETADGALTLSGTSIVNVQTFEPTGAWLQAGSLTFQIKAAILKGCTVNTFTFELTNKVEAMDSVVLGLKLSTGNPALPDLDIINPSSNFLEVEKLTFLSKSITTSNTDPCGINTVTVSFSSSLDVYANCVSSITISGLSGSKQTTGAGPTVYGAAVTGNFLSASSSWVGNEHSIIINVTLDIPKNNFKTLSFNLLNSYAQQNPITNAKISFGALTIPESENKFSSNSIMEIISASFTLRTAEQSLPYPCAENTITVSLSSDVGFNSACVATITISGLDGSSTASNAVLGLESPLPSEVGSTGDWKNANQAYYSLVLNVSFAGFDRNVAATIKFKLKNQGTIKVASEMFVEATPLIPSISLSKNSAQPNAGSGIHVPQAGDYEPFRCESGCKSASLCMQYDDMPAATSLRVFDTHKTHARQNSRRCMGGEDDRTVEPVSMRAKHHHDHITAVCPHLPVVPASFYGSIRPPPCYSLFAGVCV